jgi:hypothetical protein
VKSRLSGDGNAAALQQSLASATTIANSAVSELG